MSNVIPFDRARARREAAHERRGACLDAALLGVSSRSRIEALLRDPEVPRDPVVRDALAKVVDALTVQHQRLVWLVERLDEEGYRVDDA